MNKQRNAVKPVLAGVSIFLLLLALTQFLSYQRYLLNKVEEKERALNAATSVKGYLQDALNYSLSATRTLAFMVEQYGVPYDYDGVAKCLIESSRFIDAIELVEGGTITHIFPLENNEAAIGYNILEDPTRRKEALKAIEKKELFFAGPISLKQGGLAVVGRQPIFIKNKFWGFSAVVIKFSTLVKATRINQEIMDDFVFQLSKINPDTNKEEFFLPGDKAINKEEYISVPITTGEWNLYVRTKNEKSLISILPNVLLGFIFSLTGGFFAWFIGRQPENLRELVQQKTSQLTKAEKRYRAIVENSMQALFLSKPDGSILEANRAACELFGYTEEEFKKIGRKEIIDEQDENLLSSIRNRKNKNTIQGELIGIKKNGERFTCEYSSVLFKDTDGEKFASTMVMDISERKAAERKQALIEQRFKSLVQEGSDLISILDTKGNYKYVSPACVTILNRPTEDFFKSNAFDFIHADDREKVIYYFSILESRKKVHIPPFRFLDGNNKYRWLESTVTNLLDDPAVQGLVVNSSEISERVNYITAIEEQNKVLLDIAWMQSHVVRAPLARLMGLVNLLALQPNDLKEISTSDLLGYIQNSAEELDNIIKDIVRKTENINMNDENQS
jgi:PAS domain S-box-containing protein